MSLETVVLMAGGAVVLLLGVSVLAIVTAARAWRQSAATVRALDAIGTQLDRVGATVSARLDSTTGELNRTLAQGLQQTTQALTGSIGTVREETRAKLDEKFVEVSDRLGDLKAANQRILEFSRTLAEFQQILQSPKLRGDFGEFTLEQMLADLVPAECYDCQATIAGGRVDAVIRTPQGMLCIDSKFPLENFRRALAAEEGAPRDAAFKAFTADVRSRIDEIAVRYIAPPQTLELALMFVPSETVYYEILARPGLLEYGRSRRVIPVSPNTLYAYLQALAVGFRGLKIQQEARRVEQILADLRTRFGRFRDHFLKLGRHLESAGSQFAAAGLDVERFQATLDGLSVGRLEDPQAETEPARSGAPLIAPNEPEALVGK